MVVTTALSGGISPTLVVYAASLVLVMWAVYDMARRPSDALPTRRKAIWVIGTHPRPVPEGTDENNPSILGIEFVAPDQVTMTVSAGERFTLVKVP